jgi:hypothetical protein
VSNFQKMIESPKASALTESVVDFPTTAADWDGPADRGPFNVDQAAKELGVSVSTLRRRISKRESPVGGEVNGLRFSAHRWHAGNRLRWSVFILGSAEESHAEQAIRSLREQAHERAEVPNRKRSWWRVLLHSA